MRLLFLFQFLVSKLLIFENAWLVPGHCLAAVIASSPDVPPPERFVNSAGCSDRSLSVQQTQRAAPRLWVTPAQQRWASSLPMNTVVLFVPQQEAWVVERMGRFHRILEPVSPLTPTTFLIGGGCCPSLTSPLVSLRV